MTSPFKKRITISKEVSIYFYINTGCPKGFLRQGHKINYLKLIIFRASEFLKKLICETVTFDI